MAQAPLFSPITAADERRLLALAITYNDVADVVLDPSVLRPTDFYNDSHALIYTAMRAVAKSGESVNPVTVSAELQKRGKTNEAAFVFGLPAALERDFSSDEVAAWIKQLIKRREIAEKQQAQLKAIEALEAGDIDAAKSTIEEITKPKLELRSWHEAGITLRELQTKQFDPEVWVIENILPEGACVFAAKYKSKKSWLSLGLGIAVAMGGKAMGRLDVVQGRVLYLDLEGKQQRVQKRVRAMLGVQRIPWPDNFHVFTSWPQGDEGMEQLDQWFKAYPDTRFVVIDVLNNFRRPMTKDDNFYNYDRVTVQPMNELFEHYHAAGLLVHHFNKTKGNTDIFDAITGSTGLPSAVNTMWALERDPNDSSITKFSLRGRDLEQDDPLALKWDDYLTQHIIEGPAAQVAISSERKAVLDLMADDQAHTPKGLATELGKSVESVQQILRKLLNDGLIEKTGYGKYAIVRDKSDKSDKSGQTDKSGNSYRDTSTLIGNSTTESEFVSHHNALNSNSYQSDRDSIRSIVDRVREAGWTQERDDKGRYRFVHPELGATSWHKVPFHAMSDAESISNPRTTTEIPEGY